MAQAVDGAGGALLTAGLLCTLAAFYFSELNGLYPSAAALRLWMAKAIGETSRLTLSVHVHLTRDHPFLLETGASLESFIYAVAACCVIALRRREPDRPRPPAVLEE